MTVDDVAAQIAKTACEAVDQQGDLTEGERRTVAMLVSGRLIEHARPRSYAVYRDQPRP